MNGIINLSGELSIRKQFTAIGAVARMDNPAASTKPNQECDGRRSDMAEAAESAIRILQGVK